jgi:hypothetical protein
MGLDNLICRDPAVAPASAQIEVSKVQLRSCLDSSIGRAAACGAGCGGSRPAHDMFYGMALSILFN